MPDEMLLNRLMVHGSYSYTLEPDDKLTIHYKSYVTPPERKVIERMFPEIEFTFNEVVRQFGAIIPPNSP